VSAKTYPHKWIAAAVTQKVGVIEPAAAFLRGRGGSATGDGLSALLDLVPATEPDQTGQTGEKPRTRQLDFESLALQAQTSYLCSAPGPDRINPDKNA